MAITGSGDKITWTLTWQDLEKQDVPEVDPCPAHHTPGSPEFIAIKSTHLRVINYHVLEVYGIITIIDSHVNEWLYFLGERD